MEKLESRSELDYILLFLPLRYILNAVMPVTNRQVENILTGLI